LQNKTWDNLVRFVNNIVPIVDRLSEDKMRDLQKRPEEICKRSILAVNPSVANMRAPPKDWTMTDAFVQPAYMRPTMDTWNLTEPNVPIANLAPPDTDYAEFKQTNQVVNPVAGTVKRSVPRTIYSNPRKAAGESFSTGWTTGKSTLMQWPPAPPETGFTEVASSYSSAPKDPYWDMYETKTL